MKTTVATAETMQGSSSSDTYGTAYVVGYALGYQRSCHTLPPRFVPLKTWEYPDVDGEIQSILLSSRANEGATFRAALRDGVYILPGGMGEYGVHMVDVNHPALPYFLLPAEEVARREGMADFALQIVREHSEGEAAFLRLDAQILTNWQKILRGEEETGQPSALYNDALFGWLMEAGVRLQRGWNSGMEVSTDEVETFRSLPLQEQMEYLSYIEGAMLVLQAEGSHQEDVEQTPLVMPEEAGAAIDEQSWRLGMVIAYNVAHPEHPVSFEHKRGHVALQTRGNGRDRRTWRHRRQQAHAIRGAFSERIQMHQSKPMGEYGVRAVDVLWPGLPVNQLPEVLLRGNATRGVFALLYAKARVASELGEAALEQARTDLAIAALDLWQTARMKEAAGYDYRFITESPYYDWIIRAGAMMQKGWTPSEPVDMLLNTEEMNSFRNLPLAEQWEYLAYLKQAFDYIKVYGTRGIAKGT